MSHGGRLASQVLESLVVRLDPGAAPDADERLHAWLGEALHLANWRSRLYLLVQDEPTGAKRMADVIRVVADHLRRWRFVSVQIHPLLATPSSADRAVEEHRDILRPVVEFQREAYEEQGEPRLSILPILSRGDSDGVEAAARRLWSDHVLDGALELVRSGAGDPLGPCRRHLVVDERHDAVFPCYWAWQRSGPKTTLAPLRGAFPEPAPRPDGGCADCLVHALRAAGSCAAASARLDDAHLAALELSGVCARRGSHAGALEFAALALELAAADEQRAQALLQQGLAHHTCGELALADQSLVRAAGLGADPGFVAFHRGRIQMDWHDEIEALDRFEEALSLTSPLVSASDVHFQMASCHVALEEHGDARLHLAHATAPGREAILAFYRGVCDLREGKLETALEELERAVACGPCEEDRARMLLYLGSCLKELGRFEEAIGVLERAADAEPDEIAIHNLLGYCNYRLGRHEAAVHNLRRAVGLDPRSAIDWASLGSNLRDLGREAEAIEAYETALDLDPEIDFARDNLARLRARRAPR